MEFKDRLKELRLNYYTDRRKLSQKSLASYLGYGYTAIANYESGRNEPSIKVLKQLAIFFEVSLDYLTGLSDKKVHSDNKVNFLNRFNETEIYYINQILNSIYEMKSQ